MTVLVPTAIVLLLIGLNGLFVAAEFAIVGAPRATIERRAAAGSRAARVVARILHDPRNQDRYIATAQLGITFATLGLGMYGEHRLAYWIEGQLDTWGGVPAWIAAHTLASILAITAMTYLHVVLGEMVPKSLALSHAERTALRVTPLMLWIRRLMYPLVVTLNAIGNGLLRLVGIDRARGSQEQYYSPEELEFVVEESLEGGLLDRGSGGILRELFDLSALTAGDVMTPRVHVDGLRLGARSADYARFVQEHPHTRYPVYKHDLDDIVGVVHVRDLASLAAAGSPLEGEFIRPAPFVPDSTRLASAVKRMRDQWVQFVVVIDEQGGTAGIITPDDVNEEILGRVPEAGGAEEVYHDASGRLHVGGTVRVEELGEALGVALEHDDVETVSGLVLALLERPAEVGDVVEYDGVELRVTVTDGRAVAEAIARPIPIAPDTSED
ncbi:MAG: hemolysin family protein [Dehalococcoidia bacterium]